MLKQTPFMHSFFAALAALALCSALAGCGSGSSAAGSTGAAQDLGPNPIKLGLVASLNGDLKPWGVDSRDGAQLAVDEANAAGGVNGRKIQLLIEDSNSKPEAGKSAAEKLVSDGAVTLLGEVSSGISGTIKEVAIAKSIPQIAVGATRTDLTDGTNMVFRVCYTDKLQGPVMAKFAYDELHLRNIAIITDKKQPYSTGLSDAFRDYFIKLGGKIVDEAFYETGATQFGGQVTEVKSKNPDGIFASGYFTEVGPLVQQARQGGIGKNVTFLGGDGWDSKEILNSGGDAIVGSFFCNHYNNKEQNPVVQEFLKKWAAKYNGSLPGTTMGALGYDAARLAIDAMKRAKSITPAAIRDALDDTVDFQGVSGVITLKGFHGNPPKRALVVKLVNDKDNPQEFAKAYDYYDIFPNEKPAQKPNAPAAAKT